MNRLVIIGNGFDLAHGMPTQYADFVKWYLVSILKATNHNNLYQDSAVTVELTHFIQRLPKLIERIANKAVDSEELKGLLNSVKQTIPITEYPCCFDFKFPFVRQVLEFYSEKNWVDIENVYYNQLLKSSRIEIFDERNDNVDLLNRGLEYLKAKLEEYLYSLSVPKPNNRILEIIDGPIDSEILIPPQFERERDQRIMLLNFNYTKNIDEYLKALQSKRGIYGTLRIEHIQIHGEIKNQNNPMIFGFGDEMDDHYKTLERTNYNGFLDNIKSFGYFKTDNYHNLIEFISNSPFEVFLMGHSCGLSDRIMLNMIFEHKNCSRIKLFFHQASNGNNFKSITQNISRHFNKKEMMREKIVPFDRCVPLPQIIN